MILCDRGSARLCHSDSHPSIERPRKLNRIVKSNFEGTTFLLKNLSEFPLAALSLTGNECNEAKQNKGENDDDDLYFKRESMTK